MFFWYLVKWYDNGDDDYPLLKKGGYLPFVNESHIHDVGKFMFALSFLWSYLWFSNLCLFGILTFQKK